MLNAFKTRIIKRVPGIVRKDALKSLKEMCVKIRKGGRRKRGLIECKRK